MPGKYSTESSGISLDAASLEEEKITLLSAPDETTPEIQELARNLQHDPLLIFEFVRNKIEYVPYYGYLKGARQTLLDRAGNDADQAALLAALLRACGFTPQYVYGIQYIPTKASHGVTAARWFKVDDDTTAVDQTLIRNGIPGIAYSDGTIMDRIWVKVAIGGSTRQLDPAFKLHTRPAGIDWAAAMGYDRFALLAAAGGETNANYVRGLNEPALYNALKNSSSNLVDYFRANYANASLAEITGEPEIIPLTVDTLPTSLPFTSLVTTNWSIPPSNLIHTVRLQHGGIDKTYAVSDIAGKRLAITYTNAAAASSAMMNTPYPCSEESHFSLPPPITTPIPLDETQPSTKSRTALAAIPGTQGLINIPVSSNLTPGQIIEIPIAASLQDGAIQSTISRDFGYIYNFSPNNIADWEVVGYSNPNSATLHVSTWLENNNSGAYSFISYGGTFDVGQNQSFTVGIRFDGLNKTYGTKTANLRIHAWYDGGYTAIDDTVNLSGRVVQEPRTVNSYGMNMGITWMNNPVTGAPRLVNNGNFDLYINWMSLVGSNPDRFEFVSGNGSGWIGGGGAYRDVNTRYKADAHGSHSATVRINFSYDGVTYEWDLLGLSGQAVYQPNLNGSYGCNYGTNYYQQPLDGSCRLKNSGSQTLTINSISLTGANASQFQVISGGGTGSLGAGAQRDIGVRYLSTARGTHSASVRIVYTYDGISYTNELSLSGKTIYAPDINDSYGCNYGTNFYQQTLDGTCILKNSGSLALTINSISLTGANPSRFQLISGGGSGSLGANAQRTVGIRYLANATGTHSAYVHVNFSYDGMTYDWDCMSLQGTTISGLRAQLWLDDTLAASESTVISGSVENLTLTINHPYEANNGTYCDQTVDFPLKRGATYVVISDFGSSQAGRQLDQIQRNLERQRQNGLTDTSREVLTETLQLLGQTWMRQTAQSDQLLGQLANVQRIYHHRFGIMAQEEGYYVDVKAQMTATIARDGNAARESGYFRSGGLFSSALEHGILEQLQGTNKPGASTVKLLRTANANNQKIFLAVSNNYTAIQSQLTNYSASELTSFQSRVNAGQTLVLPENADITLQQWTGLGYIVNGPNADGISEIGMIISGDYYGGYAAYKGPLSPETAATSVKINHYQSVETQLYPAADPVDIATGHFLHDATDLLLGSGMPPLGVTLSRHYNSGQVTLRSPLGFGWHHNLDIRAQKRSEGSAGLGLRTPVDAAALLATSYIAADLTTSETNAKGWAASTLVSQWASDQMNDNAVSIQLGDKNLEFIRLPDGRYSPPPGSTAELTQSNGLYQLRERYGIVIDFNAQNRIASWKDADSNTMTFAYNAQTNLQTVTDAFGRSLTFSYDGAGSNLVSIADSTGRSVSYSVVNGNLASVTDVEGCSESFGYDSAHRCLWHRDALNQMTVSNTYSAISGKVLSQRNAENAQYTMYVVPQYRGAEENPLGETTIHEFDDQSRQVALTDPLGYTKTTVYDGQNHIIAEFDAQWNATLYTYDNHHNRTAIRNALNQTNTFTYDSQNHLVAARDPLGNVSSNQYDTEHHLTKTIDALGHEASFAYQPNGLLQTATGPRSEDASYTYDSFGNIATLTRTDGGTVSNLWNARGHRLRTADPNGNTTAYTYDNRGLPTSERDALGYIITNRYNALGRLVSTTDREGHTTSNTYTKAGQIQSVRYPDGATISNTYDVADRLIAVTDPLGHITSNRYNAAGQLIGVIDSLGAETLYTFDPNGNRVAVTDPLGHTTSNTLDALYRILAVTDPLGNSSSNEYDAAGRQTAAINALGHRTEYEYDALGRKTAILHPDAATDRFEYDAAGNRTAYINPNGVRFTFTFDHMNRELTEVDALGNTKQYSYDPGGNRIQTITPNGQTNRFAYNAVNLLTNRQTIAETCTFQYSPNQLLTNQTDNLGTTSLRYDGQGRILETQDSNGKTISNAYDLTIPDLAGK